MSARAWVAATVTVAMVACSDAMEWPDGLVAAMVGCAAGWLAGPARHRAVHVALALAAGLAAASFAASVHGRIWDLRLPLGLLLARLMALHAWQALRPGQFHVALLGGLVLLGLAGALMREVRFLYYAAACVLTGAMALQALQRERTAGLRGPAGGAAVRLPGAAPFAVALLAATVLVFVALPAARSPGIRFVPLAWYVALPRTAASAAPEAGDGGPARPTAPVRRLAGASVQDSLDLNLRGTAEDVLLMRMRCTEPRPSYHRVRTYDRWDGRCWSLSNAATRRFWAEAPPFLVAPVDPGAREITQIVTVEHPTGPSLALVAAPAQVYFPTQDLYQDATGGLDAPGPLEAGTVYSAVSTCRAVPVDDIPRLPSRDALTDDPSMQRYLATPPSLRRLGRTLGARGRSPYEKALHVWKYVYTACTYDPAAPPGRRGDAVAHFLFESKRGGSEQFASAMVLLCRAAGVHARLATGYLPEPCNPLTGVYEVRSTDFHAWAEVYVPTLGWQTFDPSPGTLSAPHRQAADASPWLLGRLLARAGGWPVAIGAACLALAWWRRRSPRAKAACGRIEALYQCAVCTLPGHVPRRGAAETQRSFAARAARRAGCPELLALVALYEREKYGGRPASGADVARGERLLAAVKARARGRGAR